MLFLAPLLLLLSPANAAECVAHSGGSNCVSKSQMLNYGPTWCSQNYETVNGNWWTYQDSNGNYAWIGKVGNFDNAQQCLDAWNDVMTCEGSKNGGSWTWKQVNLVINFCAW